MTSTASAPSMTQRYSRAARLTPPKIAAEASGIVAEGYWIDDKLYYFLAERMEPSLGRLVAIPSIANCQTNTVEAVISLETLAALLSNQVGHPLDMESLSSALFDMPDRDTLAVSVWGLDFEIDLCQQRIINSTASLEVRALYSPDGRYACFVKGHDLWVKERDTGIERPLTNDGASNYCYGQQTETALSAISYRKRPIPMGLWSPDSAWFITHRIDERTLPDLALIQHAPPESGRPVLHLYKYPIPGDPLPIATYVAIQVTSGRVLAFDDFPAPITACSPFGLRLAWFNSSNAVSFVRTDRYFKQADLINLDLATGVGRIVFSERVDVGYVECHHILTATPNVRVLPVSDEIIWFSERDGWGHLYLYDAQTGRLKNQITRGEWLVRDIVHVDEARRRILFLAGGIDPDADPARRSLCSVNLDGEGFEVLLTHNGDIFVPLSEPCGLEQDRPHRPTYAQAGISPNGQCAVVRTMSVDRGNLTQIVDLRSRRIVTLASAKPSPDVVAPRHFTAQAADGATCLRGVMFFPSDFDASRRYPIIDYIYPGPQFAHQPQSFRSVNSAPAQALAELGFVTIMLDTRGMPTRSRALHQIGYGALLEPQLADHAAVVRELCARHPFIDADRIGIIGQSGGGLATVRALCDYGEVFKVGVAACGNHDSRYYTAMWSDKYRGPNSMDTWGEQANNAVAHKLEGKLLLISGDMDENVHIGQTLSLVDALVRANKDFDLLILPNEGHAALMISGYAQRRVWDYFVRNLRGEHSLSEFEVTFSSDEVARFWKSVSREARQ